MHELSLARIRLIASGYHDLKGLTRALVGCAFCVMAAVASLDLPRQFRAVLLMTSYSAMLFVGHWLQQEYYPRRFGRVHSSGGDRAAWIGILGTTVCCVVDSNTLGKGLPASFPLFIGLTSLWAIFRDWPLRPYHAVVVVAGVVSSALYTRANVQNQSDWFIAAATLIGIAYIIAGISDHRLLVSILDNPEAQLESHCDEHSI